LAHVKRQWAFLFVSDKCAKKNDSNHSLTMLSKTG
jgi:hypothetical protein